MYKSIPQRMCQFSGCPGWYYLDRYVLYRNVRLCIKKHPKISTMVQLLYDVARVRKLTVAWTNLCKVERLKQDVEIARLKKNIELLK